MSLKKNIVSLFKNNLGGVIIVCMFNIILCLKSCVLKDYIDKDDVAVYCLFSFSIFSGKIFQLSITEETHLMKSQGSYK